MHVFVPAPGEGAHADPVSHAFAGGLASAHAVASLANATGIFVPPDAAPQVPTGVSAVFIALSNAVPAQNVTGEHAVPLSVTSPHFVAAAQFHEFQKLIVVSQ